MRVFNNLLKLLLGFYFIAILGEQLVNKYEASEKFELLRKDNKINKDKKIDRILLYGSSHCDFGLSAEKIEKITKIKTLNLCNYGLERDVYFKELCYGLKIITHELTLLLNHYKHYSLWNLEDKHIRTFFKIVNNMCVIIIFMKLNNKK